MIEKETLVKLYINKNLSMANIAQTLNCSQNKVVYWMDKYSIKRRSISEAIYCKHNPEGDPFRLKNIKTIREARLLGLGLGLYWGEGNKANKYSIRLGNTNPMLIKTFMKFLIEIFGIKTERLKFSLQIFSDTDAQEALFYWTKQLNVSAHQFYKITITQSGSIGTYKNKSKYGVLTIYFHNKKLRDIINKMLPR